MPAFFSTPGFIFLTLPALLLGAIGRGLKIGLALSVLGLVLVPFAYWGMLIANLMDWLTGR